MYYVGKFFSNVKGLYNDINPATLTGAIDVIVVKHKDGSYTTSPWHVRFGKMGVIRARQKVVDIEINGEPADLHMKLGEAGEAFFVQEADDTTEVPAYLATSPITPALSEMQAGLAALKAASTGNTSTLEEPATPVIEHCGTVVTMENGQVVVSGIPPSTKKSLLKDDRQYFSDSDMDGGSNLSTVRRRRQTEAAVMNTSGACVEMAATQDRPVTPPGEWYARLQADVVPARATEMIESSSSTTIEIESVSVVSPETPTNKVSKSPSCGNNSTNRLLQTLETAVATVTGEDCMFDMDLSDEEQHLVKPCLAGLSSSADLNAMGRCISMPAIHRMDAYDEMTDVWASKQYATTTLHGYADSTPPMSPLHSRPISPLSDSEVLSSVRDTSESTRIIDDVKWRWGELPESTSSSRHFTVLEKDEVASSSTCMVPMEQSISTVPSLRLEMDATEQLQSVSEPNSARSKVSETSHAESLVVESKKGSAKKTHIEKDGIYLDELSQDEPELAALYLYGRKSNSPQPRLPITKDEDSESGRGASLPQSPVTVEADSSQDVVDMRSPKKQTAVLSGPFQSAAMSLCGPLDHQDVHISDEKFNQSLVTFDALIENPSIVSDPKFVVRLNGRLLNWAVAGPMLMSQAAFDKPLPEHTVTRLLNEHLPKKDAGSRRGWLFWRRETGPSTGSASSIAANKETGSAPSSQQASPPDTPQKLKDSNKSSATTTAGHGHVLSDDDHEMLAVPIVSDGAKHLSNAQTTVASIVRDKCRKSLKLTSDELASLNLKEGINEATFSVTTQYQGTTKCQCYIYLWNWDDRIIVSDIDGTITKSDVLGQVIPMIGQVLPYITTDWSQAGIAQLYQMINRNGYKFLYLSARAIGQSKYTRDYLRSVCQGDINLPDGPLLLSPSSLMSAFHKEVIERKPEEFKISCLRDINALFPPTVNPFFAGFGNKINDVWAYREVGIPLSRIFTVNPKGEVRMDSTQEFLSSYKRLSDLVDHMFPPRHPRVDSSSVNNLTDYNTFNYWRQPLPELTDAIDEFLVHRDSTPVDKAANVKKPTNKKQAAAAVTSSTKVTGKIERKGTK